MRIPDLIAHRGHTARYPENTLLALESALRLGARFVEFDVQLTADQVPVLIHEPELERVAGQSASVLELTLQQLNGIEVRESGRLGSRFHNIRIPTLAEALALVAQYPAVTSFVEIKRQSVEAFGVEAVVARIVEELRTGAGPYVVISFLAEVLEVARAHGVERIGWVMREWNAAARQTADALQPDYLFCNYTKIPAAEDLWPGPWQWALYEVADPQLALQLAARGVALVETFAIGDMLADPRLAREVS